MSSETKVQILYGFWQGNPSNVVSSELRCQMWSIYSAVLQGYDLCLRAI